MLHLRKKRQVKPLSLPVLLSFNELAWIAVGAIVLVFLFFWRDYIDPACIKVPTAQYADLTNRPSINRTEYNELLKRPILHAGEVVAKAGSVLQAGTRAIADDKYAELTNRPSLGPGEVVAKTESVLQPGMRAIADEEYQELNRRLILRPGEVAANIESVLAPDQRAISQAAWEKYTDPNMTNVAVTNWMRAIGEGQFRAELLSLKGNLTNVVFILDASASMEEKGRLQMPRWAEAQSVVKNWLNLLPIHRCALIIFSDTCTTFPDAGYLEMTNARNHLVEQIAQRKPGGNTSTWSALAHAYTHYTNADTIILFTDGKPYVPRTHSDPNSFTDIIPNVARPLSPAGDDGATRDAASKDEMKKVVELVKTHPNIPINVVALGDYFEKDQANFLLELCRLTKGSFLGR